MNTARKGSSYENAYRRVLEARGYQVVRSAASKGPWDLWAWKGHPESDFLLIQLKNQVRFGCEAAGRLGVKLRLMNETPVFATVRVVHPRKAKGGLYVLFGDEKDLTEERFCEH